MLGTSALEEEQYKDSDTSNEEEEEVVEEEVPVDAVAAVSEAIGTCSIDKSDSISIQALLQQSLTVYSK